MVAVKKAGVSHNGSITWKCICDCGKETVKNGFYLRTGGTRSCGCLRRETGKKNFGDIGKNGHLAKRIFPESAYKLTPAARNAMYLSDSYIKRIIVHKMKNITGDVTPEMIDIKRQTIKLKRKVEEMRKELT